MSLKPTAMERAAILKTVQVWAKWFENKPVADAWCPLCGAAEGRVQQDYWPYVEDIPQPCSHCIVAKVTGLDCLGCDDEGAHTDVDLTPEARLMQALLLAEIAGVKVK